MHSKLAWIGGMEKDFLAAKAALTQTTHQAHPVQETELALARMQSTTMCRQPCSRELLGWIGSPSPSTAGS